jgi:GDP-4-dehydro-6-deoxy-D-mannose reductase
MKKILITGFSGFVSRHFVVHLEENQIEAEVLGVGRTAPEFSLDEFKYPRCSFRHLDLLDRSGVDDLIYRFQPTHIVHLAAYSSVGFSWQKPVESFANNTNVLLNLLEQVRTLQLGCRVLSVGSSEEYGNVSERDLPLREDTPLNPVSPYAVARVAQEMLSRVYVEGYGLDVVMTRSFNHIGTFQRDTFVVPSLAKQLTAIRYKGNEPRLVIGDGTIVRDFVDVRDVVRAYCALLERGKRGEIYNVCSGQGCSIGNLVALMQELLGTKARIETEARLLRPHENRVVIGSNQKIAADIGWSPKFGLRESLAHILDWWRRQ